MNRKSVLVTGTNGFVGEALCQLLVQKEDFEVKGAVRKLYPHLEPRINYYQTGNIDAQTNWSEALIGTDIVIHLASRVHLLKDPAPAPLEEFRRINVEGTINLAKQAIQAGVKRFIFASSIKANGEETGTDYAYQEKDTPKPQDGYGISKWEAEQALYQLAAESGLEVVILRPPLMYGPKVKANFLRLLKIVDQGVPLPFASIQNQRSFLYLGNFVDAIWHCMQHPQAVGQTFLVSDGEDISTPELIRQIAKALNRPARLFPCPPSLIQFAGQLTNKSSTVERLVGSLLIDSNKIRNQLGWKPPYTLQQGITETVHWFKDQ
jgi:nucleoside-diphosphate-sugar epimerase